MELEQKLQGLGFIYEILASMAIYGNLWQSMAIYGNLWQSMAIYGKGQNKRWREEIFGIFQKLGFSIPRVDEAADVTDKFSRTVDTQPSWSSTPACPGIWQIHLFRIARKKNYFTSSDPHHGIQFIPSDNLSGISIWHSIWHVF